MDFALHSNDISLAIAEVLGDFREVSQPLVALPVGLSPLAVPKGSCPKCIAVRTATSASCPSCGLVYERFHSPLVEPSHNLVVSFSVLQAQGAALEDHARLLAQAELLGELPQVVRLYRILLAREPANETARAVLVEAVQLASRPLAVAGAPVKKSRLIRNLFMFLAVAAFLTAVTIKTVTALG